MADRSPLRPDRPDDPVLSGSWLFGRVGICDRETWAIGDREDP